MVRKSMLRIKRNFSQGDSTMTMDRAQTQITPLGDYACTLH